MSKITRREFIAGGIAMARGCKNLDSFINKPKAPTKNFSIAFALLGSEREELDMETRERFKRIRGYFSEDFHKATGNQAHMNTSYETAFIINDDSVRFDNGELCMQKVLKGFYKENPDDFDFVAVYGAPRTEVRILEQFRAKNTVKGIGLPVFDNTKDWGSSGRLKSVVSMFDVYKDEKLSIGEFRSRGLLHEIGHQWGCYVGDNFGFGKRLEIKSQGNHFYRGLESPYNTGTPMGSDYWESNGDGTFRRTKNGDKLPKYHPFMLYFMGLLPKSEYSRKFKVYDAGIVGRDFDDKRAVLYKEVSVDDIIKVEGERIDLEAI